MYSLYVTDHFTWSLGWPGNSTPVRVIALLISFRSVKQSAAVYPGNCLTGFTSERRFNTKSAFFCHPYIMLWFTPIPSLNHMCISLYLWYENHDSIFFMFMLVEADVYYEHVFYFELKYILHEIRLRRI